MCAVVRQQHVAIFLEGLSINIYGAAKRVDCHLAIVRGIEAKLQVPSWHQTQTLFMYLFRAKAGLVFCHDAPYLIVKLFVFQSVRKKHEYVCPGQ